MRVPWYKGQALPLSLVSWHRNRRHQPRRPPFSSPCLSLSSLVLPLSSSLGLEGWIYETHVLNLRGKGGPSLLVPSGNLSKFSISYASCFGCDDL